MDGVTAPFHIFVEFLILAVAAGAAFETKGSASNPRSWVGCSRISASSTARRRAFGGLGLSYAHRVALAHRGDITATSQPGRGSTFTVVLPAAPPLRTAKPAMPAKPKQATPPQARRTRPSGSPSPSPSTSPSPCSASIACSGTATRKVPTTAVRRAAAPWSGS